MPLYIEYNQIGHNSGDVYLGTKQYKKVYIETKNVWEKNIPPETLFQAQGAPHPEYAYPYGVESLDLGSNPLSGYNYIEVVASYSYYDTWDGTMVWETSNYSFFSYGNNSGGVPDLTVSLSSSGLLDLTTTGGGPMGGFLYYPVIIQVIAYP